MVGGSSKVGSLEMPWNGSLPYSDFMTVRTNEDVIDAPVWLM